MDESTTALLPHSVSTGLPPATVAVPISEPADRLETQLVWRTDNKDARLAAFVEVSGDVFADALEAH